MNQESKELFGKMVDYKRFGIVLTSIGAIFYLGLIIPSNLNNPHDMKIMALISTCAVVSSFVFFIESKRCQTKLLDMEEEQD